jgi:hypothetical protein
VRESKRTACGESLRSLLYPVAGGSRLQLRAQEGVGCGRWRRRMDCARGQRGHEWRMWPAACGGSRVRLWVAAAGGEKEGTGRMVVTRWRWRGFGARTCAKRECRSMTLVSRWVRWICRSRLVLNIARILVSRSRSAPTLLQPNTITTRMEGLYSVPLSNQTDPN